MFKYLFTLIVCFSLAGAAFGQKSDTIIIYYSYAGGVINKVPSLAQAQYFRMILPPDSGDNRRNVKEFYKDGKIKLITKLSSDDLVYNNWQMYFDGDFISYYPNGKKFSIGHYIHGWMNGMEYRFYPNGRPYCTLKHITTSAPVFNIALLWECYDTLNNQICREGNGRFIKHVENFAYPDIVSEGPVVKGYPEGEWQGHTEGRFDLKFKGHYKKGRLVSAVGYDSDGNTYPFKDDIVRADYKTGQLTFVEMLRSHIKLPPKINGKKVSIDTMHISFIVEKDGHLTHPRIQESADSVLQKAVFAGLGKTDHWSPTKIFGIPVRTAIWIPLNVSGDFYNRHVGYWGRLLKDDEKLEKW